jgi:PAS domain S-box-containing protein
MSASDDLTFSRARVLRFLEQLERRSAGDEKIELEISPHHDELDAIAFGIKVLADELRWTHARMAESEGVNFATAFHSNPCAMAIVRLSDGRFQDVNEGFERQTGYQRADVIGRTREESGFWIEPRDLDAIGAELRSGARVSTKELQYRTRAGEPATAIYSADIIQFRGEPCVLSASIDVTDQKKAEVQAASLRWELAHRDRVVMLNALTGSLAHEINQPLGAIMNNVRVALKMLDVSSPDVSTLREILQDVMSDSRRAGDVIWRMRSLLKKGETHSEPFDLNQVITAVVTLVEGHTIARRISLTIDLTPVSVTVVGDPVQMQQVALNLLMNAFDAVQELEPVARKVWVRTFARDGTAAVEVSDGGSGLTDDQLARIFEPFHSTKREGIGLGLWLCREIVLAHRGRLTSSRSPQGGMTFTAAFPEASPGGDVQPVAQPVRQEQQPL